MEQETEDSIERPVVGAFLKVELGSFKVTMKTDGDDLCTEDSRVNTKSCAVWEDSLVKDIKISICDQTVVS